MTNLPKSLEGDIFVAPQVPLSDLADLAGSGFTTLVCHRPDGEDPGQPSFAAMDEAARALGLVLVHIPVSGLPHPAAVDATAEVIATLKPGEKMLMFCRSGMRSTAAWAMVQARSGRSIDDIRATAAAAGYDLSRLPL